MRFSFLALLILCSTNVWAVIKISAVSGASAYISTGTATIIGSLGGDDCTSGANGSTTTCNSCQAPFNTRCNTAPLCACNEARIMPGSILHIEVTKDTADTGLMRGTITGGTATTALEVTPIANTETSIDIRWSDLCAALSDPGCAGNPTTAAETLSLQLYADKDRSSTNNTGDILAPVLQVKELIPTKNSYDIYDSTSSSSQGIDDFVPYAGDAKVYITKLHSSNGFPNFTYGGIAQKVRVYVATASLDNAEPTGSGELTPQDLDLDPTSNTLQKSIVDGLENGTRYFVRMAVLDNGNNVVAFFPRYTVGNDFGTECTTDTANNSKCAFSVVPDQVLGMLSKDFNCFIATAAYGSSLDPKLQTFRDFRFYVLLRHNWGVWLVKKYYSYGPYAARFIYDKPLLRALVRGILWPIYGFSWLSVRYGLTTGLMTLLILLAALSLLPWYGFRRFNARV